MHERLDAGHGRHFEALIDTISLLYDFNMGRDLQEVIEMLETPPTD